MQKTSLEATAWRVLNKAVEIAEALQIRDAYAGARTDEENDAYEEADNVLYQRLWELCDLVEPFVGATDE